MKKNWPWAILTALIATSSFANGNQGTDFTEGFLLNVGSLQTSLGLGSVDPSRAIQQSTTVLRHEASSPYLAIMTGTTSATNCNTDNVVIGSTACSPLGCGEVYSVNWCWTGRAWKWLLTIHNPAANGWVWKNLNSGSGTHEVSQAVLRGILKGLAGASAVSSNCLSGPSASAEYGDRMRNTICEEEIESLGGSWAGHHDAYVVFIKSNSLGGASDYPPGIACTADKCEMAVLGTDGWIYTNRRDATTFSGWGGIGVQDWTNSVRLAEHKILGLDEVAFFPMGRERS
jgi:hypothetical protein